MKEGGLVFGESALDAVRSLSHAPSGKLLSGIRNRLQILHEVLTGGCET